MRVRNLTLSIHCTTSTRFLSRMIQFQLIICDAFCDFGACGGTTSSAENATLNDVNKFKWRRTLFNKHKPATFNN